MKARRYAVFYAPPAAHPLWRAGCQWLGRDPAGQLSAADTAPSSPELAEPWRYGFHATLKPPMQLRDALQEHDFMAAVQRLAERTAAFMLPPLVVTTLGDFVALRPSQPPAPEHPLRQLADACVRELDDWRAPPTAQERQRRFAHPLDAEQTALLMRWGYPHVLQRWRMHLTLSNSLPPDRCQLLLQAARTHFGPALDMAVPVSDLAVYVESAPGAPFVLAQRFALQPAQLNQISSAPTGWKAD
jgi:hypothetical protein